jgi:D-beta-D-heptose 7-phosphate kinase/D-beta-D-heptose 1-phosphate adenosyltransferase
VSQSVSHLVRTLRSKIKSPATLKKLLAGAKKRIVFTNGCFDIIHKGHVQYLERSRKLGDVLVVALNTDASVRRLKGKGRPINGLTDRLEVMASFESVDWVTWFEDDTPLALIRALKPGVLVKGGDWKPAQIVGGADVLSWGGKVKSLPYVEGRSTTQIIERARK